MREDETIDLGHDPGADRKISATQTEHDQRRRQREQRGDGAHKRDRKQRIEAADQHEREQEIATEADKSLLAHGDQAGIAREQVPALCQRHHVE